MAHVGEEVAARNSSCWGSGRVEEVAVRHEAAEAAADHNRAPVLSMGGSQGVGEGHHCGYQSSGRIRHLGSH